MSRFIKLTNLIINVSHIHNIQIKNQTFYIHLSSQNICKICQKENPTDYHYLQRWIDRLYVREM